MATKSFITYTPASGSGNGNIQVSAGAHTGRKTLGPVQLYVAATGCDTKTVTVYQAGKSEFVSFDESSQGECIVPNTEGEFLTLTGLSNSAKLKLEYTDDSTKPMHIEGGACIVYVNGSQVTTADAGSAASVAGDPGNSAQYAFAIKVYASSTTAVGQTTKASLKILTENGAYASVNLKQTGATPTLSVSPTTINLDASGTTQSVYVTSNTSWSVS